MDHTFFAVSMLLPAVALCLAVLSTFCGWAKAYLAICWIPVTLFLIINGFESLHFEPDARAVNFGLMLKAVCWTSLVQGLVGVVIAVGAALKKEEWVLTAIATLVTIVPFLIGG